MGLLPSENATVQDIGFFKIDEAGYDPETMTFGSDWLIKNNNTRTVTVPSDIKPGTYVVRHEIIALHNSWQEDKIKQTSGAQHYPNCFKVEVTGSGMATPPSQKFPGTYHWNDPGILINIYYGPNQYVCYSSDIIGVHN
jgi:cellulase